MPLIGVIGYVSNAPNSVVRQLGGVQYMPRMTGLFDFFGLIKHQSALEVVENIK